MHEYKYSEKNVYEYNYFIIYSTLECNHDYFNEYRVSTVKVTFIESPDVIIFMLLCHYLVF